MVESTWLLWKGLEFESCVCHLCVILIVYYFGTMLDHDEW